MHDCGLRVALEGLVVLVARGIELQLLTLDELCGIE